MCAEDTSKTKKGEEEEENLRQKARRMEKKEREEEKEEWRREGGEGRRDAERRGCREEGMERGRMERGMERDGERPTLTGAGLTAALSVAQQLWFSGLAFTDNLMTMKRQGEKKQGKKGGTPHTKRRMEKKRK